MERLTGHFEIWDFSHPALAGPIMTRADDALGLVMVFSLIAHAAVATLQGSAALPPIHYGPSSCCDLTRLCCVATNFIIHFFSIFQVLSDGSRRFPWTRTCCKGGLQKKKKKTGVHVPLWFIHQDGLNDIFSFFHSLLENFQLRFSRFFKFVMTGPMVPMDSPGFTLWSLLWTYVALLGHLDFKRAKRVLQRLSPLSLPPKQNENPHPWLQASGASHDTVCNWWWRRWRSGNHAVWTGRYHMTYNELVATHDFWWQNVFRQPYHEDWWDDACP